MKLFNSLTQSIEAFEPINPPQVGMYTCGPTVYDYVTIGNWRTYTLGDLLLKTLQFHRYQVNYIMNITDVGHLTGDNLGDADLGDDRMEKAATREGKTAWDIAAFYTQDFLVGFEALNLQQPANFVKATDHISEQISLVQEILNRGFAYRIQDGIYFDTKAYEAAGNTYGQLSTLDQIKAGARIEPSPDKKDPRDFALWKFSKAGETRQMEWDSPWGKGFPGWHIECSAMSMKYLSNQFDLHLGGEDLKSTHHPNEIAQSEAATGKKPFVKYWVHGAFLQVDGGRMGKSLGNAYTLANLVAKGFSPLSLRYFYLTGHYRKPLNFTFEALTSAQTSLEKLHAFVAKYREAQERQMLSQEKLIKVDQFRQQFKDKIGQDLNFPEALAVVWEVIKSNIPSPDKYDLLIEFDEVLGLNLRNAAVIDRVVDADQLDIKVRQLLSAREALREAGDYDAADQIRTQIEALGYRLEDTPQGIKVVKNEH